MRGSPHRKNAGHARVSERSEFSSIGVFEWRGAERDEATNPLHAKVLPGELYEKRLDENPAVLVGKR